MAIRDDLDQTFRSWRLDDLLVFIIPTVAFVEWSIIGRIFAPEVLLLTVLPLLLARRGRRLAEPLPRAFLLLGLAWLLSQVGTDIIQGTEFRDYTRGWAKICFFLLNFMALFLLIGHSGRRIIVFAAGMALGIGLAYFFNPNDFAVGLPWKFGYGQAVTIGLVILAVFAQRWLGSANWMPIAIVLFAGALNIYMGSRALGGVCIMAAFVLVLRVLVVGRGWDRPFGIWSTASIGLLAVISVTLTLESYGHLASSGMLGEGAREKYEFQTRGGLGILLGGRSEILVAGRAILDSPIIGHGSWAQSLDYAIERYRILSSLGMWRGGDPRTNLVIPSHSHLFGAWVEAGLLGGIFWLWVLYLALRAILRLLYLPDRVAILLTFLLVILVWDVLFSPFGAQRRYTVPYMIVGAMWVVSKRSNRAYKVSEDELAGLGVVRT